METPSIFVNLFLNGGINAAEEHTQFIFSLTELGRAFLFVHCHLCSYLSRSIIVAACEVQ